jgi:hypothetical protein
MSDQVNSCQAFFEAHEKNPRKVEALCQEPRRFDWEKLQASRYSPGPVTDEEELARVVISPIHIDAESGNITPAFVSDVKNKGGSSDRLAFCSAENSLSRSAEIQARKNLEAPPDRQRAIQGVVRFSAKRLRALNTKGGIQAFGVFDTGKSDNPAHADVCQLTASETEARSARWDLLLLTREGFTPIEL